jgi:phospho-N-acetylmuramoyl-pentapeptide-transferase
MLYWLGYERLYHPQHVLYTPFRVFQYATFRIAMASITALLMAIILGPWVIARLRQFQIGQHIREDGPKSHHKKADADHGRTLIELRSGAHAVGANLEDLAVGGDT